VPTRGARRWQSKVAELLPASLTSWVPASGARRPFSNPATSRPPGRPDPVAVRLEAALQLVVCSALRRDALQKACKWAAAGRHDGAPMASRSPQWPSWMPWPRDVHCRRSPRRAQPQCSLVCISTPHIAETAWMLRTWGRHDGALVASRSPPWPSSMPWPRDVHLRRGARRAQPQMLSGVHGGASHCRNCMNAAHVRSTIPTLSLALLRMHHGRSTRRFCGEKQGFHGRLQASEWSNQPHMLC
jgi:hypothetical protein